MSQEQNLLIASLTYIESLKRIASEAETIAKLEGCWDEESGALLNFPWLCEKFELFWFESREAEEILGRNFDSDVFFSPIEFERLVQSVLLLTQDRFYRETPATGDGGIDLIYKECIDPNWDAYATTLVQCKLYRGYVPVSEVRDFFGVISANTASGLFVTTGKFTNQARSFLPLANRSPHSNSLYALDGQGWKGLLAIAKECHSVIDCATLDGDSKEIQEHAQELNELRRSAKYFIRSQGVIASQENLF